MTTNSYFPVEIAKWVPHSSGVAECPECGQMWDHLAGFTPSGVCVQCAAMIDPPDTARPHSNPFWLLTPEEIDRAAGRAAPPYTLRPERLERTLPAGDWWEAERPVLDAITKIQREAMLLAMLRGASRQCGRANRSRFPDNQSADG